MTSKPEPESNGSQRTDELQPSIAQPDTTDSAAEWAEIDLIAPTDEELMDYVENVRPPLEYYAE